MMGDFVDDAIYGALNSDADATNDVDMFFNNAGGIRIDWCDKRQTRSTPAPTSGSSTAADCSTSGLWAHDPMLLTYGQMFQILPFGNATAVGTMTGAQIYDLLNQSATLFKGALQPSGIRYKFYRYSDALPGPQPYAWGAYDVEVFDQASDTWLPLDAAKTYKVGTNEFLAPAGQDGFTPFKYMKDITYWGDMLERGQRLRVGQLHAGQPVQGAERRRHPRRPDHPQRQRRRRLRGRRDRAADDPAPQRLARPAAALGRRTRATTSWSP